MLLERIIALVTFSGDSVLDPFCGSGSTLVAAELLGRNSIGIDISTEAVTLARQRLEVPSKTSSELLRKGRESYVQSDDFALAHLRDLPILPVQRKRVGRKGMRNGQSFPLRLDYSSSVKYNSCNCV